MRRSAFAVALLAALVPAQESRFHTNRSSAVVLPLPKGEETFSFVVLGDRTGGPVEGIAVLAQAVADINLLDPDLVMTVGDLVNGYNDTPAWLAQMREYKDTMGKLKMPWYPVAGNHDIYMRAKPLPVTQHETEYEQHFGPLWYAFEHKRCLFVALYSDEGDPKTGKKAIDEPACQVISERQLTWLQQTLQRAKGMKHVFVFLHHPRWLKGKYGDDWDRVHALLKGNGNVKAVFAGHIHRVRYDGERDGIEYFTTAATGAFLDVEAPRAGYLHEFHVVTVREGKLSLAVVPVGQVIDPRTINGEISEAAATIGHELKVVTRKAPRLDAQLACAGECALAIRNPCTRPIEITLALATPDPRWAIKPDHLHVTIPGGEQKELALMVTRAPGFDPWFDLPVLSVHCDYLAEGLRVAMPERSETLRIAPPAVIPDPGADRALACDGKKGALRLDDLDLALDEGPFTIEAWLRGTDFAGRRGLINKTEQSDFGFFVGDGKPSFIVYLGDKYVAAETKEPLLKKNQWHHIAGVYDGSAVRLYVDGKRIAETPGAGSWRRKKLPLYIGADVNKDGGGASFFAGLIDEVRITKGARYTGESFAPLRRVEPDASTVLLLHCDAPLGPWMPDSSGGGRHAWRVGGVGCVGAEAR